MLLTGRSHKLASAEIAEAATDQFLVTVLASDPPCYAQKMAASTCEHPNPLKSRMSSFCPACVFAIGTVCLAKTAGESAVSAKAGQGGSHALNFERK
jgi:hypothetical protein